MNIKSTIIAIIPSFLTHKIRLIRYKKLCKACYEYDATRFTKYSNAFTKWDNPEKLIGLIIAEYHVIEKGLAMPDMRLGFGKAILNDLISHCNLYASKFDREKEQFIYALRVIAEYKLEHEKNNYKLEDSLFKSIDNLLSKNAGLIPSEQIVMTKKNYFKSNQSSFEDFSNSRKSLRNFSGIVDLEIIKNAVSLAQNAPSACNRQPSRVYVIQEKERIEKVLKVQTGNRGFGHLADKLIVLTAESGGYLGLNERNDVFVNGGIYAMNLLYALHYYQIGACPLNWCAMPEQDIEIREICGILPSEAVIMIIACGGVPENFKLVTSHRNDSSNILKVI
jgi:nitroreductase